MTTSYGRWLLYLSQNPVMNGSNAWLGIFQKIFWIAWEKTLAKILGKRTWATDLFVFGTHIHNTYKLWRLTRGDDDSDQLSEALLRGLDTKGDQEQGRDGFPIGDEDEILMESLPENLLSKADKSLSLNERFFHNIREWIQEFREMGVLSKIQSVMELPFTILRTCSIPMTSEQDYSRPLLILSCALMPLWFLYYLGDDGVGQGFGTMNGLGSLIALGCGLCLALLVYLSSTDSLPPRYGLGSGLALVGFVVAATWIDKIADELVAALQFLGIIAKIDDVRAFERLLFVSLISQTDT